ncbi:hypothetical protein MCEMIH16_02210 [Caulobacteraceae bacterium]|jgi:hypothetical protein
MVDPIAVVALVLIFAGLTAFLQYQKVKIRRLDRIIAEKEAAMNAPEQRTATPQ